jgi:hypothetical protein
MPQKDEISGKNTTGDNSVIIGDNSSLTPSMPEKQSEKLSVNTPPSVVGSESAGSKLIPFLCYAK